MKTQNETPKYATLLYDVLKKLELSPAEYFYLDMVHKLSYHRWCSKSLENCAYDMNITRRGLINIKNRMLKRGLIEKNLRGHVKVTAKYTEVAVNKVHQQDYHLVNKVPKMVKKVHSAGEKTSLIENNNENNKEKKAPVAKNGTGFKKYMATRKRLGLT